MFRCRRRNVQVGRGLGNILGTLTRAVGPVLKGVFHKALPWLGITTKSIAKEAAKKAMTTVKENTERVIKEADSIADVKKGLTQVAKNAAQDAASQAGKKLMAEVSDQVKKEAKKVKGKIIEENQQSKSVSKAPKRTATPKAVNYKRLKHTDIFG